MERIAALVFSIISLLALTLILYYGGGLSMLSSFVLSAFLSFILLNVLYPPMNVAGDKTDFTLTLYAILEILYLLSFSFYIVYKTLTDIRPDMISMEI